MQPQLCMVLMPVIWLLCQRLLPWQLELQPGGPELRTSPACAGCVAAGRARRLVFAAALSSSSRACMRARCKSQQEQACECALAKAFPACAGCVGAGRPRRLAVAAALGCGDCAAARGAAEQGPGEQDAQAQLLPASRAGAPLLCCTCACALLSVCGRVCVCVCVCMCVCVSVDA